MRERRGRGLSWELAALLCLAATPCGAAGTAAADFLSIPVGGRPAALGGAYGALAVDAYAPVWNPAGLPRMRSPELAAMHLDYAASIGYEFVGGGMPLGKGHGLGFAVQYLHPKKTAGRDAGGAETGAYSSYYGAYTLAYGRALGDALSVGAAAKAVDAAIAGVSARAYAADLGALLRAGSRWTFSAVASDLGTKLDFLGDGQRLPDAYRLGALFAPVPDWRLAAEAAYADGPVGRAGVEWQPAPLLALRAGYHADRTRGTPGLTGLTAGVGLEFMRQRFDYAWAPMGDLGQTHYFAVLFAFGKEKP